MPKAFDHIDDAIAEFHSRIGSDMKNPTLSWALCMVIDSDCAVIKQEKWTEDDGIITADAE